MDYFSIKGGKKLQGEVAISGAKNAALPLMAASLLTNDTLTLSNVPELSDIQTMVELLENHSVKIERPSPNILHMQSNTKDELTAPYEIVRKMRASIVVLGPILARFGYARVSLPGGCAIGSRPVDLHLKALEALGAEITLDHGYVEAKSDGRLKGGVVEFPFVSVGATENILMAATLADGITTIHNAAREPEITDLANCLVAMGAKINGIGTSTLEVEGVESLHGAEYSVLPDRIEAGTFAIAAAITRGKITLTHTDATTMESTLEILEAAGCKIDINDDKITIDGSNATTPIEATTTPHPGFPTDMQAQFMALSCLADGRSTITEAIFENRFMHVPELNRMGADIQIQGQTAIITGKPNLIGAEVMATDLRASVSLVLAALAAEGHSKINRIYHIDRGYEHIVSKFQNIGADIERAKAS